MRYRLTYRSLNGWGIPAEPGNADVYTTSVELVASLIQKPTSNEATSASITFGALKATITVITVNFRVPVETDLLSTDKW